LLNCLLLSLIRSLLSLSSSGEKFQSLSNQIRTVHWINLCKHCLLCLIFLSIYKNPLYPPSLIWLFSYWSIIIWIICSLFNYSFTLYFFTKKNDQYSLLDWTCWIFFSVFPFLFSIYFARAILLLHMTEKTKQKRKKFVNLLPSFIPHTTKHEKNGRTFFPHHLRGDFKLTSRTYILNTAKLEPDLVTFWSNHWIKTSNIKRIKEKSGSKRVTQTQREKEKTKQFHMGFQLFSILSLVFWRLSAFGSSTVCVTHSLSLSSILSYSEFLWQLRSYSQIHSTYFIL
jgi:hypothetical protein